MQYDNSNKYAIPASVPAIADGVLARLRTYGRALTAADLAELLNVSKPTIHRMCEQKAIPHFKVGKLTRFLPSLLAQWVLDRQHLASIHELLRLEQMQETGRSSSRAAA
ncbi:MAG: helix-turn-helix domain-containing protein [Acidobacteriia bacterium]|nr:helix-turn-helix domain-containing protein [Terriglobia bacterium]